MSKLPLNKLLFSIAALAASSVIAQPFGLPAGVQPANPQPKATASPMVPLSPQEFEAQVTTKSKQAQQDLFRQAQTNFQQQKTQMPLPNSPPAPFRLKSQTSINPATPTTQDNNSTQPAASVPPPASIASPSSSPTTSDATTPAAEPAQNQSYTGFGSGSTTQQPHSSTPSSQSSGGWSIKY